MESLRQIALEEGACLLGVADLAKLDKSNAMLDREVLDSFPYAVSVAVRLSRAVLDEIEDRPTKAYFHHYRMVNLLLDQIALKLTAHIQGQGHSAYPIPASQIVDWEKQMGHLSHKHVAQLAGLGRIGRNNLLVTPEFGSQVRLVTVLTDMPLEPGTPCEDDCSKCRACIKVCPAAAIKENAQDFDHMACYEKLQEFKKKGNVGQYICGICVKACVGEVER